MRSDTNGCKTWTSILITGRRACVGRQGLLGRAGRLRGGRHRAEDVQGKNSGQTGAGTEDEKGERNKKERPKRFDARRD